MEQWLIEGVKLKVKLALLTYLATVGKKCSGYRLIKNYNLIMMLQFCKLASNFNEKCQKLMLQCLPKGSWPIAFRAMDKHVN